MTSHCYILALLSYLTIPFSLGVSCLLWSHTPRKCSEQVWKAGLTRRVIVPAEIVPPEQSVQYRHRLPQNICKSETWSQWKVSSQTHTENSFPALGWNLAIMLDSWGKQPDIFESHYVIKRVLKKKLQAVSDLFWALDPLNRIGWYLPGISEFQCVNKTDSPLAHLKVPFSSTSESPIQKYLSVLSPTRLVR